jgi:hypothetical protein
MNGECSDCGAAKRETMVLGFACQHERCPMMSERPPHVSDYSDEETKVCASCGCEELDHRGLLTCRCGAMTQNAGGALPKTPATTPPPGAQR